MWNFHAHLFFCDWKVNSACLQFSSVAQSCPTLCDPVDCSSPCPSPLLSVYREILNVQKHLLIEGRNGHFPGLPMRAPWVWCLLQKPALSGADSASAWQCSLGQLSPGIPTSSCHPPSQNQVVLITIHCPLQSESLRMLVHPNVNKHHRERFHHRVTLEDVVS